MTPSQLNHYRILEPLGKRGMGEVFVAEDTRLQRRVALQVLSGLMSGDPERRTRFEREARAVAALNHPNIVTSHSLEEADGLPFLTMELGGLQMSFTARRTAKSGRSPDSRRTSSTSLPGRPTARASRLHADPALPTSCW